MLFYITWFCKHIFGKNLYKLSRVLYSRNPLIFTHLRYVY